MSKRQVTVRVQRGSFTGRKVLAGEPLVYYGGRFARVLAYRSDGQLLELDLEYPPSFGPAIARGRIT